MKIENLKQAERYGRRLACINNAIDQCDTFLNNKTKDNMAWDVATDKSVYTFYLSQYEDGSDSINLTGCGVALEVVRAALRELIEERVKLTALIESL